MRSLWLIAPAMAIVAASAVAAEPAPPAQPPAATATPTAAAASITPLVTEDALQARQARRDPSLLVLDVRRPDEYAAGHVPGAVNVPHDQLATRLDEIPRDKDVVVYCYSGRRAAMAEDILRANGYQRVSHLQGDMAAWQAGAKPLEKAEPAKP